MRHYTLKTRLLCLFLAISLISLTACHSSEGPVDLPTAEIPATEPTPGETIPKEPPHVTDRAEQERFSAYTYDLFLESVLDNTVNLHYTIADPESYGITEYPITLGAYEVWSEEDLLSDLDEMSTALATYDYAQLTAEQQMTYDILTHYIGTERLATSLALYTEPLGPTTGAATQLPITLAEYSFYREQDIKDYLQLLPLLRGYFESIILVEQAKAEAGLFMTASTLDTNIKICKDFVANPDSNFLITSFASRMEAIDWLDEQTKADYIKENKDLVFTHIFPAFEYLADSLGSMRDYCTEEGGLTRLPEGKEYFTYLMETRLGADRTPEEMLKLIESYQQEQLVEMYTIRMQNRSVNASLSDENFSFSFTLTNPDEILTYLEKKIAKDYPAIPDTTYTLHYVEKELEDVLSPAFYMIPPMDRYLENTIYINNGSVDESTLFTTLAHEGYPGHLYQNVYFNSHNTEPLRSMLSYLGYSEGWATYVECEAYAYDPALDQDLLRVFSLNNSVTLSIYAALDIHINYDGWNISQAKEYLLQYFSEEALTDEVVSSIYNSIAGDPCYYLAYHGGYLEIMEMRRVAEATLGSAFDLKEFHQFVLDLGECPFSLANQRLADWLE